MVHVSTDTNNDPVCEDHSNYTRITNPNDLLLQEKFELMMAIMDHLKIGVFRAEFDSSFLVLAPVKD